VKHRAQKYLYSELSARQESQYCRFVISWLRVRAIYVLYSSFSVTLNTEKIKERKLFTFKSICEIFRGRMHQARNICY
jgi:hypothetical protein